MGGLCKGGVAYLDDPVELGHQAAPGLSGGKNSVARWQTMFKHCIQQETVENQFYLSKFEFSHWLLYD